MVRYFQNVKDKDKAGNPREVMPIWGHYIRIVKEET